MEHALVLASPYLGLFAGGAYLRWAAVPALVAFAIGRKVEQLKREG